MYGHHAKLKAKEIFVRVYAILNQKGVMPLQGIVNIVENFFIPREMMRDIVRAHVLERE